MKRDGVLLERLVAGYVMALERCGGWVARILGHAVAGA